MAEGIGLAASVIAVLQITNSVISVCYHYSAAVQGASWELPRIRTELENLRTVLQTLEPLAIQAELAYPATGTRLPTLALLGGTEGLLQNCLHEVKRLDETLKSPSWSDRFGPKRKAVVQVLRWPLQEADTKKALKAIGRYKEILAIAITADQTKLALEIQNLSSSTKEIVRETQEDVKSVKDTALDVYEQLHSAQIDEQRKAIYRWLSAPDPSANHNNACRSRQATTGSWFLESEMFTDWKECNPLLWLYGKAGCGKTILSSTIISEILRTCSLRSGASAAYFYFDFNEPEKQKSDRMIRSLITQLSGQSTKKLKELELLFSSCNNGQRQPDTKSLLIVLKDMLKGFDKAYVILDALDECSDREQLLESIEEIQIWGLPQLHMLLTSRQVPDVQQVLELLTSSQNIILIQSKLVDADILIYVHERLQNDSGLKRWRNKPQVQEKVKTTLMKKADGMFRWAVCQLDALKNCFNLPTLQKALESLPPTLDETYSRILCNIAEEHREYAITLLQWLTYSARPLRIEELAETVAINMEGEPWFDCDARFPEPRDILLICSSLVIIGDGLKEGSSQVSDQRPTSVVRLAHFSVKEYLVSERVRAQPAKEYAIREIHANKSIAATCLAYLLQFDQYDNLPSDIMTEFPLARYAAQYWIQHVKSIGKDLGSIQTLSMKLFLVCKTAYINWVRFCDPENPWDEPNFIRGSTRIATPLYYVSFTGSIELVQSLLDKGVDVNAQDKPFDNALTAASYQGHEIVIRLLLDNGADVNAQGGLYDNALQAASFKGHEVVIRLLLDNGANVNALTNDRSTALHVAAANKYQSIVSVLIEYNASLDALNLFSETALHLASRSTFSAVVSTLIQGGANPLIIDDYGRTSLDWASMYRPCLEAMGDSAKFYAATSQSTYNARLKKTLTKLIEQVRHETVSASYDRMGRVLLFLDDLPAAYIAFEQTMSAAFDDQIQRVHCNHCHDWFFPHEFRYICRSCAGVDFCEFCFEFRRNEAAYKRCQNHEFVRIPRDTWRDLKPDCVDENGKTVQMWLMETYERYKD